MKPSAITTQNALLAALTRHRHQHPQRPLGVNAGDLARSLHVTSNAVEQAAHRLRDAGFQVRTISGNRGASYFLPPLPGTPPAPTITTQPAKILRLLDPPPQTFSVADRLRFPDQEPEP